MPMRAWAATAGILCALAGCGGQGAGGGTGGGAGTGIAPGGSGGKLGTIGADGGGAGRGGSTGGSLPACAITTRPNDPTAATISALSGTCNTIVVTADGVTGELVVAVDGGVEVDGGAKVTPAGGTIRDGDYDLIRWQNIGGGGLSYRTLRVFDGGAYIEWNFHQADSTYDGGFQNLKFDTNVTMTAETMTFAYTCGGDVGIPDFGYSATGNDLLLFDTVGFYGLVDSVDTYQRTCAR
jgi:hypothetical protein